jgi:hypothetical protein
MPQETRRIPQGQSRIEPDHTKWDYKPNYLNNCICHKCKEKRLRKILVEGREWLIERHLPLPDPFSHMDVIVAIDNWFDGGWKSFCITRYMGGYNRFKKDTA